MSQTRQGPSSSYRGVTYNKDRRKWESQINPRKGMPKRRLGFFDSEVDAAKAYDQAAREIYENPVTNFFEDGSLNPERKNTRYNQSRQGAVPSSSYRGVGWCARSRSWRSKIYIQGKEHMLGLFKDEVEAAKAFDRAVRRFKVDRILNFPDQTDGDFDASESGAAGGAGHDDDDRIEDEDDEQQQQQPPPPQEDQYALSHHQHQQQQPHADHPPNHQQLQEHQPSPLPSPPHRHPPFILPSQPYPPPPSLTPHPLPTTHPHTITATASLPPSYFFPTIPAHASLPLGTATVEPFSSATTGATADPTTTTTSTTAAADPTTITTTTATSHDYGSSTVADSTAADDTLCSGGIGGGDSPPAGADSVLDGGVGGGSTMSAAAGAHGLPCDDHAVTHDSLPTATTTTRGAGAAVSVTHASHKGTPHSDTADAAQEERRADASVEGVCMGLLAATHSSVRVADGDGSRAQMGVADVGKDQEGERLKEGAEGAQGGSSSTGSPAKRKRDIDDDAVGDADRGDNVDGDGDDDGGEAGGEGADGDEHVGGGEGRTGDGKRRKKCDKSDARRAYL